MGYFSNENCDITIKKMGRVGVNGKSSAFVIGSQYIIPKTEKTIQEVVVEHDIRYMEAKKRIKSYRV